VQAGALALALLMSALGPFAAGNVYAGPPEPSASDNPTPNDPNSPDGPPLWEPSLVTPFEAEGITMIIEESGALGNP
jgi:hypothetical protein